MRKNIAYIISLVHKANIFEWTAEELNTGLFRQVFILLHDHETEFERNLRSKGYTVYRIDYSGKKQMLKAVRGIMRLIHKEKIDIVHSHLFDAGVAGMLAAWIKRVPKRIHTRHDATVNHDYYPHAVKWDKFTNRLATDVIAITESVKEILHQMERVPLRKITVIHHGFRLECFSSPDQKEIDALKLKYFPQGSKHPVIGVISRYIEWKGIEYTIDAFRILLQQFPNAHLLLANASGPGEKSINEHLAQLPQGSYTEIRFESSIFALYHLFDVFVHVPIDEKAEAFGQIYVEAMAAGIPCIVTMSGIAHYYIRNEHNALVVPFRDSDAIHTAMVRMLNDEPLRRSFIKNAYSDVTREFSIQNHVRLLEQLYLK